MIKHHLFIVATILVWLVFTPVSIASIQSSESPGELKALKLNQLNKRSSRAYNLVLECQTKIDKLQQITPNSPYLPGLKTAIQEITMTGSAISEQHLAQDIELLQAIAQDHKEPEDLTDLQERYKKLCQQFDDLALNKDFDRAFHVHDRFIRYTSLGLWDKEKISSELERMETLLANAPDIPYGKTEYLDTIKGKKLASIPKLVYVGYSPQESMYLAGDRLSVAVISECMASPINMEMSEHTIQSPDEKLVDITLCNNQALGLPFSPPLTLWMKSRMLNGCIPGIIFKLSDNTQTKNALGVQDILDGKLDEYLQNNLNAIAQTKIPAMVGFLMDFDQNCASNAFGSDGRTPFYTILDPKLNDLPSEKLQEELKKRFDKGAFSKKIPEELCTKYGDKDVPDGPERVRDAWKKVKKILDNCDSKTCSLFSVAGNFHGNKNAQKFTDNYLTGSQAWNKLDYYWPGDGVIDWLGICAVGDSPTTDAKGPNITQSIGSFMTEVHNSNWQTTPVMLYKCGPAEDQSPFKEAAWIETMFQNIIPATFPNISCVVIDSPKKVTLWTLEAKALFKQDIANNKFFNYPQRFKKP